MEIDLPYERRRMPRHLCVVSHGCCKNDGQGRVNYEIVKAALKRGWLVTFVGSAVSDDLCTLPSLRWLEVPRSRAPSALLKNLLFAMKGSLIIRKYKKEFDIIHTNGFIVWSKSNFNTAHFVHSGWLKNPFYPYRPPRSLYSLYQYGYTLLNSHLERGAFRASQKLIAVSEKVKEEFTSIGIAEEKIAVIHNGVDLEEFYPGQEQRAKFSLPEAPVLFLFAGDIRSKRKNLEAILQALTFIPEIHLAVAGALEGSPYPKLAKKLGVDDRVHFLGSVVDMANLMRSVDIFVFPSRYEPFGLVILEALASGLPVITALTAGGAEVVGQGGLAISSPDDIDQLVKSMEYLARDTEARATMAKRARQVATELSWTRMTERYLDFYEQC
jgi:glycosyltransferase involved in cell wall biosynthesis